MRCLIHLLSLLVVAASFAFVRADETATKLRPPRSDDLKKARTRLIQNDLHFRYWFNNVAPRDPKIYRTMANELWLSARKTEDSCDHYAYLCLACDSAIQGGAADMALNIVNEMAQGYDVKPLVLKAEVARRFAEAHKNTPAGRQATVEVSLRVGWQLLAAEDLPKTRRMLWQARGRLHSDGVEENKELADRVEEFSTAVRALLHDPNDAAVWEDIGYHFAAENDWGNAFLAFARSKDDSLISLAERERSPQNVSYLELASDWMRVAEECAEQPKQQVFSVQRASFWFRRVDDMDRSQRAELSQRLAALESSL